MRLVCLSDTHETHRYIKVPDGDIFVFAGDSTNEGSLVALNDFATWLFELPHKYKIIIAGNHDTCFDHAMAFDGIPDKAKRLFSEFIYLEDQPIVLDGVKFYGTPWTPKFETWAFQSSDLQSQWNKIPEDVDVLVTHSPPQKILDFWPPNYNIGCPKLLETIGRLRNLKVNVVGHAHTGYGQVEKNHVRYVNASICDEKYLPVNTPIVVDL